MQVFIVEYTDQEFIGNQCGQMEIEAPNLETAYELVNEQFPELAIDTIYAV